MGFTTVDGLMMGTRSGEIDPGVLLEIMDKEGLNTQKATDLINKQSGLLGVSGISSDWRDVREAAQNGNDRAQLAMDMYMFRIKRFVGAYMAELEGADMIVFTGGIAENVAKLRHTVCKGLESMGIFLDNAANEAAAGEDAIISTPDSPVKVVVATTNEELVIASDTFRLLRKRPEA